MMASIYYTVGFGVVWLVIISLIAFTTLVAVCYSSALFRMYRVCRCSWRLDATAWPKLTTNRQKVRAFFKGAYFLMTSRVDAQTAAGNRIPSWPWEPMPE